MDELSSSVVGLMQGNSHQDGFRRVLREQLASMGCTTPADATKEEMIDAMKAGCQTVGDWKQLLNNIVASLGACKVRDYFCKGIAVDAVAEGLRASTTLHRLQCYPWTQVIEACRAHPTLAELKVVCLNDMGDQSQHSHDFGTSLANLLRESTALTDLCLYAMCNMLMIDPVTVESICDGVRGSCSLRKLRWCNCRFGDDRAVALAEALRVNTSLTELDVVDNGIGADGACALAASLTVSISNGECVGVGDVGDGRWDHPALRVLDLSWNKIGDAGCEGIGRMLQTNSCLTELRCDDCGIGSDGLCGLSRGLRCSPSLTKLSLRSMRGNHVDGDGAVALGEALRVNTCLTALDLNDSIRTDDGMCAIASSLTVDCSMRCGMKDCDDGEGPYCPPLAVLDLYCSVIGTSGCEGICRMLQTNTCLTDLSLSCLLRIEDADGFACMMRDGLGRCCVLRKLNLFGSGFGDEGAVGLAEALRVNTSLTHLDVRQCGFGDEGACALAGSVGENAQLGVRELLVSRNRFGDEGLCGFGDALKTNRSLTLLEIHAAHHYGQRGVVGMCDGLRVNSSLISLVFDRTPPYEELWKAEMQQVMRVNTTLEFFGYIWGDMLGEVEYGRNEEYVGGTNGGLGDVYEEYRCGGSLGMIVALLRDFGTEVDRDEVYEWWYPQAWWMGPMRCCFAAGVVVP